MCDWGYMCSENTGPPLLVPLNGMCAAADGVSAAKARPQRWRMPHMYWTSSTSGAMAKPASSVRSGALGSSAGMRVVGAGRGRHIYCVGGAGGTMPIVAVLIAGLCAAAVPAGAQQCWVGACRNAVGAACTTCLPGFGRRGEACEACAAGLFSSGPQLPFWHG